MPGTTKKKTTKKAKSEPKKVSSPLSTRKQLHETKEKLVDAVMGLLGQIQKLEEDKDAIKARLLAVSNKKLLRLHEVGSEIKSKFGSMEKLADAVVAALGRAKDLPYRDKLRSLSPARLLDLFRAADKRSKQKAA